MRMSLGEVRRSICCHQPRKYEQSSIFDVSCGSAGPVIQSRGLPMCYFLVTKGAEKVLQEGIKMTLITQLNYLTVPNLKKQVV